jgi:hypothetical protein
MKIRYALLPLLLISAGCREPEVNPVSREVVELGLAQTSALQLTPQNASPLRDLMLCTPPEMDVRTTALFAEKIARLGYRILWLHTPALVDSPTAAILLRAGVDKLSSAGKKGLMIFGSWQGLCPGLSDSTFEAVIWVTSPEQAGSCLDAPPDSTVRHPQLALITPAPDPVVLTPAWRNWLHSAENLVWLATGRPVSGLLQSDLEPIVRRKAQLFFDRHLKGKR